MKKFIVTFLITILLCVFGTSAAAFIATQTDATITDATVTDSGAVAAVVDEEVPDTGSEEFEMLWGFIGGIALVAGGSSVVMYKKNK